MKTAGTMLRFEGVIEADFEAMANLRAEALRESLEHLGRFDPVRVRERLRAAFVPACMQHIASDGERIGYLTLVPQASPPEFRLHHLYIRPGYQSRGVGAWALDWVKAQAREHGCDVTLGALRDSAANRFYLRHGFTLVEEQEFDLEYRWSPSLSSTVPEVAP